MRLIAWMQLVNQNNLEIKMSTTQLDNSLCEHSHEIHSTMDKVKDLAQDTKLCHGGYPDRVRHNLEEMVAAIAQLQALIDGEGPNGLF